jgi:hypothetical protein
MTMTGRRAGQTGRVGEGKAKVRSLKSGKSIEFLEGFRSRTGSGNSATPSAFEVGLFTVRTVYGTESGTLARYGYGYGTPNS